MVSRKLPNFPHIACVKNGILNMFSFVSSFMCVWRYIQSKHCIYHLSDHLFFSFIFTEIPQIVFMTFVDECCRLVKQDLKYIYFSKKVRETVSFHFCFHLLSIISLSLSFSLLSLRDTFSFCFGIFHNGLFELWRLLFELKHNLIFVYVTFPNI